MTEQAGAEGETRSSSPTHRRFLLEAAAVSLLALVMVFLLYGGSWLSGKSIFRGAVQEQYYLMGQYAFDRQIERDLAEGFFPLWNPYNALGTPLLGNMLSGVFYPLKFIVYASDNLFTRDLTIVIRLLLAALFTHFLARRLCLSLAPSLLASQVFAFTGYMKMFVNENYLNADVLLPGLMLFTLRLAQRRKALDFAVLAALVFAVINNGHPEAAFYTLLFPAFTAFFCIRKKGVLSAPMLFSLAFASGFLICLPMILPFLEYWFRGYHFHVPGAGFFHYSARRWISLASPWFFGRAPAGAAFLDPPSITWAAEASGVPPYNSTNLPWLAPAFGMVPLFLALVGASKIRRLSRIEIGMIAFSLFFGGVMFGLPLFRLIGYLPVFNLSGNFKHPHPGLALCAAILAGRGLSFITGGKANATLVSNVLMVFLSAIFIMVIFHEPLPGGPRFLNAYSVSMFLVTLALGAFLTWFAMNRVQGRERKLLAMSASAAALAGSMFCLAADSYQQPPRDPDYESRLEAGGALDWLERNPVLDRVYISQDISPPNVNILYSIADLRVMDGVNDRRLVRAINAINGHGRAEAGDYWYRETGYLQPAPDRLGHRLLELFNVSYALMDGPLPYNRSISSLLANSEILSPGPGHVGPARLPVLEGTAPSLLQHPPSRIDWTPAAGEESGEEEDYFLRLGPAAMAPAAPLEEDGAWLMAFSDGMIYARHIHPGFHPGDKGPLTVETVLAVGTEGKTGLTLSSLPASSPAYDQVGWADFRLEPGRSIGSAPWEELVRGETWLYRDPKAMPRAFPVGEAIILSESDALAELVSGMTDPRKRVILSLGDEQSEGNVYSSGGEGPPGVVESIEHGSNRVTVEADMWRPGWLVLSDLCYPGWKARLKGAEKRVARAYFLLRAVTLKEGKQKVEFSYEPWSFRMGLWAAIAGLVSLAFFIGAGPARRALFEKPVSPT